MTWVTQIGHGTARFSSGTKSCAYTVRAEKSHSRIENRRRNTWINSAPPSPAGKTALWRQIFCATTKGQVDMRNIDKIKLLEKELGRYKKAVSDRDKVVQKQKEELENTVAGSLQLQAATDALISAIALSYGQEITEDGGFLGWRLTVPKFSVEDMRGRYEVHARRDGNTGDYIVGVVQREDRK